MNQEKKPYGFIKIVTNEEELLSEALSHADNETIEYWENKLNISQTSIIKELHEMLIKLNIGGSPRIRENGLLEVRSTKYGSTYGRTVEELEAKLIKKIKAEKSHCNSKNSSMLLSDFYYENYLPFKKVNIKQSSIDDLQISFNFIVSSNFDKPLNRYTAENIEKFLYSIPQTRKRKKLRGVINNMLTYAKKLGKIKVNPCDEVSKVKHVTKVGSAMSFDTQLNFFDNIFHHEKLSFERKLFVVFVYLTGTRRGEALSISVSDFDLDNNALHIPGTKTDGSDRVIPLAPLVKKVLDCLTTFKNLNSGKLFDLTTSQADSIMRIGSPDFHLHELRHTFGTIAVCVKKLDPKTVSIYMGHSDIAITLKTYTHPEQLDKKLFYDGSKSESEKIELMRQKYQKVLDKIEVFLNEHTQLIPKN